MVLSCVNLLMSLIFLKTISETQACTQGFPDFDRVKLLAEDCADCTGPSSLVSTSFISTMNFTCDDTIVKWRFGGVIGSGTLNLMTFRSYPSLDSIIVIFETSLQSCNGGSPIEVANNTYECQLSSQNRIPVRTGDTLGILINNRQSRRPHSRVYFDSSVADAPRYGYLTGYYIQFSMGVLTQTGQGLPLIAVEVLSKSGTSESSTSVPSTARPTRSTTEEMTSRYTTQDTTSGMGTSEPSTSVPSTARPTRSTTEETTTLYTTQDTTSGTPQLGTSEPSTSVPSTSRPTRSTTEEMTSRYTTQDTTSGTPQLGTSEPTSSTSRPIPEETENSTTDYTDTNTSSTPLASQTLFSNIVPIILVVVGVASLLLAILIAILTLILLGRKRKKSARIIFQAKENNAHEIASQNNNERVYDFILPYNRDNSDVILTTDNVCYFPANQKVDHNDDDDSRYAYIM